MFGETLNCNPVAAAADLLSAAVPGTDSVADAAPDKVNADWPSFERQTGSASTLPDSASGAGCAVFCPACACDVAGVCALASNGRPSVRLANNTLAIAMRINRLRADNPRSLELWNEYTAKYLHFANNRQATARSPHLPRRTACFVQPFRRYTACRTRT